MAPQWISPKDELPTQGKKVLWLAHGDLQLVMRFDDFWLPIPFTDHKMCHIYAPELWQDIILPPPLEGKLKVMPENSNRLLDIDEVEMMEPEFYKSLVNCMLSSVPQKCVDEYFEHMGIKTRRNLFI